MIEINCFMWDFFVEMGRGKGGVVVGVENVLRIFVVIVSKMEGFL